MKGLTLLVSLALFSLLLAGCTQPGGQTNNGTGLTISPTGGNVEGGAKKGDAVKVDYLGTLTNGKVFDTSIEVEAAKADLPQRPSYAPLAFTVGAGEMIAGFDAGVVGMKVGEEKTITIPPEEAYGPVLPDRIVVVGLDQFGPQAENVTVGMTVSTTGGAPGKVTAVNATHATIDFNHALAGQTLIFKIFMREIKAA